MNALIPGIALVIYAVAIAQPVSLPRLRARQPSRQPFPAKRHDQLRQIVGKVFPSVERPLPCGSHRNCIGR